MEDAAASEGWGKEGEEEEEEEEEEEGCEGEGEGGEGEREVDACFFLRTRRGGSGSRFGTMEPRTDFSSGVSASDPKLGSIMLLRPICEASARGTGGGGG